MAIDPNDLLSLLDALRAVPTPPDELVRLQNEVQELQRRLRVEVERGQFSHDRGYAAARRDAESEIARLRSEVTNLRRSSALG